MGLAAKHLVWKASRAVRAANSARRRALERDMAAYSSAADLCEIQAVLDRYPDAVTGEMRDILTRQHLARARGPGGFSPC